MHGGTKVVSQGTMRVLYDKGIGLGSAKRLYGPKSGIDDMGTGEGSG